MRNLFALLWKNQFFILFVLLEILSLFLLSKSYSYHGSLAYSTTSNISGEIYTISSSITDYFSLKTQNERLVEENAHLKNMLSSSFLTTDTQYVYRDSMYRYIPVKIVNSTVNKANNFIMVNKGKKHGVKKEMGVVSTTGLTGIVVGVSDNFSTIMSMLHSDMRISARINNSNQLVNVIWDQDNYLYGTVIDIPSHIQLLQGDSIVTSGNSLIFPENILIGLIESHELNNTKSLSKAKIKFSTDFNSVTYLFVIDNIMKPEQDSLLGITINNYE